MIVYSKNLLDNLGLDADEIVNMKMGMNERKYPVEKAKVKSAKYDCLLNSVDIAQWTESEQRLSLGI